MKTIHVLGTGQSVKYFKPDGNTTIGVNDIWKHHPVDHLLILDNVSTFSKERFETIINSKPEQFYSTLDEWRRYFPDMIKIEREDNPGAVKLDSYKYLYSVDSTFTAVHMAYKMGATKIILHGVDFYGHQLSANCEFTILMVYETLHKNLRKKGVELYVNTNRSLLVKAGVPSLKNTVEYPYQKRVKKVSLPEDTDTLAVTEKEKWLQYWKTRKGIDFNVHFANILLGLAKEGFMLDIGCGNGQLTEYLRMNFRFVYGLDITIAQIPVNDNNKDLFIEAPAWAIPYGADSFYCSYSFDLLGHIPLEKAEQTVKEIIRVTARMTIHAVMPGDHVFYMELFKKYNNKGLAIVMQEINLLKSNTNE